MALKEAIEDALIYTTRAATGVNKTLNVAKHVKQRIAKGELFNFSGSGVPFSTTGKIMLAGWGVQNVLSSGYEGYAESKLGTPSGEMLSATPRPGYTQFLSSNSIGPNSSMIEEGVRMTNEASYYNSAVEMGATGDLVFAMNNNRRG